MGTTTDTAITPSARNAPATGAICPVCKTTSYLNKDLELLINPECYHQMCAACVERFFGPGPAQCPYAGCGRTLRKKAFRPAFFDDLSVEREVDARRRVAAIFNKAEDDFESVSDHNAYLERVETLTFDLLGSDAEARAVAEAELREWEQHHRNEIEERRRLARESEAQRAARESEAGEAARRRRLDARREDAEDKARDARAREEVLDGLASGADVGEARATMQRLALKKRGQGRLDAARSTMSDASGSSSSVAPNLSIRGLKRKEAKQQPRDDGPYDPFGGLDLSLQRYSFAPLDDYRNEWMDAARLDTTKTVGGYSAEEFLSRAMFEAFSGIAVFIEDEKGSEDLATTEAAQAAATVEAANRTNVDAV